MEFRINPEQDSTLKIGIIGAGFSGTALAAALYQFADKQNKSIEIHLFEKTGSFGLGEAYKTELPFHLLNVRARDMSIYDDQPGHFVDWLNSNTDTSIYLDQSAPVADQFAPRKFYGDYLKMILNQLVTTSGQKIKFTLESAEVIDIVPHQHQVMLKLKNNTEIVVDKAVLALGNNQPADFPFTVSPAEMCINDPWDYHSLKKIPEHDPVLIVGTGLSMIDTVLTLHHQQHQGKIYAVSRHGLMPLPHSDTTATCVIEQDELPSDMRLLTKKLRHVSRSYMAEGGDWRSVINSFRVQIPSLWERVGFLCKKRFLRHVLPYWNIHRHRVTTKVIELIEQLAANKQLKIMAGRVASIENGIAKIKLRHTKEVTEFNIKWVVNCMGPSLNMESVDQPLVSSLLKRGIATFDQLNLGFATADSGALKEASGAISTSLYTLGPPAKAATWESGAVPDIRKQSFRLAKNILEI